MQVEPSHLEKVTQLSFQPPSLIWPYKVTWWEFQISLFRYGFYSKIQPRCKLNKTNRERSPNPLLVPNHNFGYSTWLRPNKAILWPDSWSPQKTGPDTSWTVWIGGGQISNRWLFVSILCFSAWLGKVSIWDHQIWNLWQYPYFPL